MATYNGTSGDDTYTGTDVADTIHGNGGDDTLSGGAGDDSVYGDDGDDMLAGDDGSDTLHAGGGRNTLYGGNGSDTFYSTGGVDTIYGGTDGYVDRWYADYTSRTTALTFNDATGTLSDGSQLSDVEFSTIDSGYGADTFTVGTSDFAINAGGGEDTIAIDLSDRSRPNENTLYSSFGASVDGINGSVFNSKRTSNGSSFSAAEHVSYLGLAQDEQIKVKASAVDGGTTLLIDGGAGFDHLTLDARKFAGLDFVQASDGSITSNFGDYRGMEDIDILIAGGGNHIVTGDGSESITGSARSGTAVNTIDTGDGKDFVSVVGGTFTVNGGAGDDYLSIGPGATFDADGGAGEDSFGFTSREAITFHQDTGTFADGSELKGYERLSFYADGSYFLNSSKTVLDIGDNRSSGQDAVTDVSVDLSAEVEGVHFSIDPRGLTIGNITVEGIVTRLALIGTQGDDSVTGANIASVAGPYIPRLTAFDGGAGYDTLQAYLRQAGGAFIVGDDGSVTSNVGKFANIEQFDLTVTAPNVVVQLGDGDDTITAYRSSGTTLSGGGGDDTIDAAKAKGINTLNGNGGDDILTGGAGADTLVGEDGADKIMGGAAADKLTGGRGDDLLKGGLGDDTLAGGDGDDILDGQDGTDTAGYDGALAGVFVTLATSAQQNTRGAGLDLLVSVEGVVGSAFADRLTGNGGANLLDGGAGNDLLKGGAGDDHLIGNAGVDRLTGGGGADTFVFDDGDFPPKGLDTILDFHHTEGDRIDVSSITPDPTTAGDQAFIFVGAGAFSGGGGAELRVIDQAGDRLLVKGDLDGDGRADFAFVVHTDATLVAGDFVL